MSRRIEDYALVGDTHTVALVSGDGSIDWLCVPRFDSGACFAALLGDESHGRWRVAPASGVRATRRRYRDTTLVLETEMDADGGTIRVVDFMPPRARNPVVVRVVEGVRGTVPVRSELTIRFDYGSIVPWVRHHGRGVVAIGGPDALWLSSPVDTRGEDLSTVAEMTVRAGDRLGFVLDWQPSGVGPPKEIDPLASLEATERWWRRWAQGCTYDGEWADLVRRSLVTLKALTYAPTGGVVAAPTTSLPERLGGVRNWDYRFCWLRDAAFVLDALLVTGFEDEALAWRDWLGRAVAGDPADLQTVYGLAGERRLTEVELPWLPGYETSRPVRVGNAAHDQLQLDVFGDVIDCLHLAAVSGAPASGHVWDLQLALLDFVEGHWRDPDNGLWEVRSERRDFTH